MRKESEHALLLVVVLFHIDAFEVQDRQTVRHEKDEKDAKKRPNP